MEVSPRIPFDGHINQNGACPTHLTPSLSEKSQVLPDAGRQEGAQGSFFSQEETGPLPQ